MFTELDVLLDGHHVLTGGDDLHVGQAVFLVPLDKFTVEVVEVRDTLLVQPVTELASRRAVVLERLLGDAGLLVVEVAILRVVRRSWFQAYGCSGAASLTGNGIAHNGGRGAVCPKSPADESTGSNPSLVLSLLRLVPPLYGVLRG